MKKYIHFVCSIAALTFITIALGQAQVTVPLNDPNLRYDGSFYNTVTETKVSFNRHKPEVVNHLESGIYGSWINQWVITQTGVRIRFKTMSPTINLSFEKREGGGSLGTSPSNGFSVFANGTLLTTYSSLSFTITNPNASEATLFEVSLPNLWAVDFIGMTLANTYTLEEPEALNKPVYVAIGDSKAHGTGQYVSSAKTYPFQLAALMEWDLYNMAVAGSTLGWAMALNLKGVEVDVVTIELGYNDWEFSNTSLANLQVQYEKLIDSIRRFQPNAQIFCITPIANTDLTGAAPYSQDDYRLMVQTVVAERMQSDDKLFVISGPEISNTSMLASGDKVHLSESGAAALAQNLVGPISDPSTIVLTPLAIEESAARAKKKIDVRYASSTEVWLSLPSPGNYAVQVYGLNSELLASYHESNLPAGESRIAWTGAGIKGGSLCIIRVQGVNEEMSKVVYIE